MKTRLLRKIRKKVQLYKVNGQDDCYFLYTKSRTYNYAKKQEALHVYYDYFKYLKRKIYWKEGRIKIFKNKKVFKRIR